MNKYYHDQGYENIPAFLSEDEFIKKHGAPPWIFVNDVLTQTNIPYNVSSPMGTRINSDFRLVLKDLTTGAEIISENLSTGEKVLMSLALAIYNTSGSYTKPELLLIDEPDAALHPSMSKKMISVLKDNIVNKAKIPVIITSHSPTTVISTDGISIYQMERGNSIPQKISAQKAVEILSSDIPFLKISTEDRRQVFVESKYDVIYYELLTNIIAKVDKLNSKPIYIPARTSNGSNCEDVVNVVENLFKNGNDQIYGIVDWDLNSDRENRERIIILGNKNRYAIENYLLDPLLMGLFFIREAKKDFNYFGISEFSSYSQLVNLSPSASQSIIDKVLNDLELFSSNKVRYRLQNGWELEVTKEFCEHQGHSLEELYKIKYPFLKSYQREDALKKDIILKIINDLPIYTPIDIFETILEIK